MAIKMVGANFETMDLAQVFGDNIVDQIDAQPGLDHILDQVHNQAVARILALTKDKYKPFTGQTETLEITENR